MGKDVFAAITIIAIVIFIVLFAVQTYYNMEDMKYYENRVNEAQKRVDQLEAQGYGSSPTLFTIPLAYASSENDDEDDNVFEQGEVFGSMGVFGYDYFQDPDGNLINDDEMGERLLTCMEMKQKNELSQDIQCSYWVLSEEGITEMVTYVLRSVN